MTDKTKPNLIAYTHAPATSPGVQGLHIMLFKALEAFSREYNVFVLCRNRETYEFYQQRFLPTQPEINLIPVPDNLKLKDSDLPFDQNLYEFGLMEDTIDKAVEGRIDKVFWFWPGMKIVTPESRIKEVYDGLSDGRFQHRTIAVNDVIDGSVVQQAEMLYSVIKYKPRFIYRVGDYTEPHIEKLINYPMKLVSYYPNTKLGHQKIHDAEWFHFSDFPVPAEKIYDFIFGYTVEIPERAYLSDFCFEHIKQNDKVKLYVKDKHFSKHSPINTQLKSDEYFDKLRYAKFSLIAPSTDFTELSLNRVYEDLVRRCVPIFMRTVQYWMAFDDEINHFIKENLVYNEDIYPTLNEFIETLDYEKLLSQFFEFDQIKKLQDRGWLYNMLIAEIE